MPSVLQAASDSYTRGALEAALRERYPLKLAHCRTDMRIQLADGFAAPAAAHARERPPHTPSPPAATR